MQNAKVLSLIAPTLVFAAVIANHAFGRLNMMPLQRLPVETFPRTVGAWKAGEDRPMDAEVRRKLPTAHTADRIYKDSKGREINLLLLSATEYADFHDPNWCFPGQGFKISPTQNVNVGGRPAYVMTAERDGSRVRVLYWWMGDVTTKFTWGREQIARLMTLRNRARSRQAQSLFVRLLAPDNPGCEPMLEKFAGQILPSIKALKPASGSQP